MPRVHTHYDNLRVARDAPIEVIRAAYRSLALKYHPDHNPGSAKATRITRIINTSYGVLSDPAMRAEHDRWIRSAEYEPAERPGPPPPPPPPRSPRPEPPRAESPRQTVVTEKPTAAKAWLNFILAMLCSVWFLGCVMPQIRPPFRLPWRPPKRVEIPQRTVEPTQIPMVTAVPATVPVFKAVPAVPPPTVTLVPRYVRPSIAPNGLPWPVVSGYLLGEPQLNEDGESIVTIDNTGRGLDTHVKLYEHGHGIAVRQFLLRAREQFTMMNLRAGTYAIHFKDLDSGDTSESEPFTLREDAHAATTYELTLYTVPNGNTKSHRIDPKDF
jgi:hypothetical protein